MWSVLHLRHVNQHPQNVCGIALAFYYAGDAREGRKALRQVVEVRPDIFLDKRKVPKEALDDLEAIKSRIAGTPARPVKVVSAPPGVAEHRPERQSLHHL